MIALFIELLSQIWPSALHGRQLHRLAAVGTMLLLAMTVVGIVAGFPRAARAYTEQRLTAHPCQSAIAYLREQAEWPNRRIVSDQIDIWRDFYPWLRNEYAIRVIDGYDPHDLPWETMIAERLDEYAGTDEFWWITYTDQPSHADRYFAQPAVHILEEQVLGACRVLRVLRTENAPIAVAPVHGGPINLMGYARDYAKVGEELHLVLYWQSDSSVATSYTVFVHLFDEAGQLVTQQDNLPGAGLAPTTSWQPGVVIRDPYRLAVPTTVPPGRYQIHVGLYTADGRVALQLPTGTSADRVVFDVEIQ
ncbi:MAG: hypothetical protein KDE31_08890 [Caldilineaceae bacterium]|nr:hypothetical protein [Caldilineaceae bacterium]